MRSLALLAISLLVLLLPLEPMEPLARVLGFELSHLEVFASALLILAGAACLSEPRALPGRHRTVPLVGYAVAFLAVCTLSSILADGSATLPLKFTLRMTAGTVAFLLTSKALSITPRFEWLFFAFALAGAATATLALLEAGGFSPIEPWIASFREHAFEVGGSTRVAATFSYPNTAGGFLVLVLPPLLFLLVREGTTSFGRALAWVAALGIFAALLLTYSRGALMGALAATISFWALARRAGALPSRNPLSFSLSTLHAGFALVAAALFFVLPSLRFRATSEGDISWYRARIDAGSSEMKLDPGELASTEVRVANVGRLTWDSTAKKPFHLSYRWFLPGEEGELEPVAIEGERTRLPCPLAPGEEITLRATVRAPRTRGQYVLVWDMVQEHATWFSDKIGLGEPVSVVVGGARAEGIHVSQAMGSVLERAWRPGRGELWRLALELFRAHPLLGVGPDNFRWMYGPAAGRKNWDTRVFSNSLYFELLATVGLLGFLAFGLFVAAALHGLIRSVGPGSLAAAAVASSLIGFLVHGLVDYLLAFTPIYLAVFILLGAASASISERSR
jgi:O-Antigen ligase